MTLLTTLTSVLLALLPVTPRVDGARVDGDDDKPQVIRLKVGTEIVGTVTPDGFDEAKGVRVRRVDDDSLLDIGFDQMLPEDARRIRAERGFLPDDPDPILVDAMKIRFLDGTELVGIIVEQSAETIMIRRGAGPPTTLKRSGVRLIEPVKVDALEVYDAEELYGREAAARNPTTALDHYNLALFCESLQLWTRAKEQLAEVQKADPAFKAEIISSKQKQYERRLDASEDSELIAKAQRMVRRDDYNGALATLDDFLQKKPGSPLRGDAEKAKARITKARERWLAEQVVIHFFTYLDRAIRKIAQDPKATPKDGRKSVEADATKNAIEATAKWLHVTPPEVQRAWEDANRRTASPHFGAYGAGTWTIGLEAALKGLVLDEPNKKAGDGTAKGGKDESLEDRIKKLVEERKRQAEEAEARRKQGGKGPQKKERPTGPQIYDVPPKEDEWWVTLTIDEKTQYLTAWWSEHDPNVKIIRYDSLPCAMCTGVGMTKYINRDGQEAATPCLRCKGLGFDRIVRFH